MLSQIISWLLDYTRLYFYSLYVDEHFKILQESFIFLHQGNKKRFGIKQNYLWIEFKVKIFFLFHIFDSLNFAFGFG